MQPIKTVTITITGFGLGIAYLAKLNALSKGRSTEREDQAIEMGITRLKDTLKN
ncbi:MAG: hypothetical protein QNJ33_20960 [Crocosphaera sp.]|nr:hypothetical protein [Crocosphaera sp.]